MMEGMGDGILICVACATTVVSRPMLLLLLRAVCASVILPQPGSVLMSMARFTTELKVIQMSVVRAAA